MLLHIINKSPFEHTALASCLRRAQPGASLLLIEDGVYAAQTETSVSALMHEALRTFSVYALKPDVDARGLQARTLSAVKLIDYEGFVDLVAQHSATQSWF